MKNQKVILTHLTDENNNPIEISINEIDVEKVNNLIEHFKSENMKFRLDLEPTKKQLRAFCLGHSKDTYMYLKNELIGNYLTIEPRKGSWSKIMFDLDKQLREGVKEGGQKSILMPNKIEYVLLNKYGDEIQADINFKNITQAIKKREKSGLNISDETTEKIIAKSEKK